MKKSVKPQLPFVKSKKELAFSQLPWPQIPYQVPKQIFGILLGIENCLFNDVNVLSSFPYPPLPFLAHKILQGEQSKLLKINEQCTCTVAHLSS